MGEMDDTCGTCAAKPLKDNFPYPYMEQLGRVELTENALQVLKIKTALCGLSQNTALEALILRGASSQILALLDGKTELEEISKSRKLEKISQKPLMELEEMQRIE